MVLISFLCAEMPVTYSLKWSVDELHKLKKFGMNWGRFLSIQILDMFYIPIL
jgi:hypothetical protein